MRFKKGTKVEVMTQKELPSGSWRCAEILGGNGHSYTVKYEGEAEMFGKAKVERVPRKVIRPCPPPVDVLEDWVSGDVVEVFHDFSWKMAIVLKVLGGIHLLVRLLGSAIEIQASKYDVRPRLCWQDDEWILIGKASSKSEDLRFRIPSARKDSKQIRKVDTSGHRKMSNVFCSRKANILLESPAIPSRTLKRKLPHSRIDANDEPSQKNKLRKRACTRNSNKMQLTPLPEKVDGVAFSREMLHENRMHPSLINKINGCPEMNLERENTNGDVGYSRSISLESNDDHSVSSSVGSCSVYRNSTHKMHHVFAAGQFQDNDDQCSDAESFCQLNYEEGNSFLSGNEECTEEECTEDIHRIELYAYRCTIGALYASGPLSWEQELLLTNLRDSLHISNDEHLMEIRTLVSSSYCIPCS